MRVLFGLLLPLLATFQAAGQGQLSLQGPNPRSVRVGETTAVNVVYSGAQDAELLRLPRVPGVRLRAQGPSRSSFMEIIGGRRRSSSTLSWTVQIRPLRTGKFTIPALRVRAGGKVLETRATTIECVEDLVGKKQSFIQCGVLPPVAYRNQPVDVWIQVGIDEALLSRLKRVHQHRNVVGLLIEAEWWDEFPAGVSVGDDTKDLPGNRPLLPVNRSLRAGGANLGTKQRDGRTFRVFEVRRRFLPNREGRFRLDAPLLQFEWAARYGRDIFGDRTAVFESAYARGNAPVLEVRPLPETGRPGDFRNAVGSYRVSGELSKRKMKVGENVKLELRIEGDGNLEFLEVPPLDDLAGFHLFGKNVERFTDRVVATYDIAPLDDQQKELPRIPFSYFDPADPPSYKRADLEPIPIEVVAIPGGKGLEPLPSTKKALTPGVDDIWDRMPVTGEAPQPLRPERWMIWAAMLTPLFLFVAGFLFARRRAFLRANPALVRSQRALEQLGARLPTEGTLRAFSLFVAERMGWDEGEAVRADLRDRLAAAGLPPALAARTADLMHRLQESRYAGAAGEEALAGEAMALAREIDAEARR